LADQAPASHDDVICTWPLGLAGVPHDAGERALYGRANCRPDCSDLTPRFRSDSRPLAVPFYDRRGDRAARNRDRPGDEAEVVWPRDSYVVADSSGSTGYVRDRD